MNAKTAEVLAELTASIVGKVSALPAPEIQQIERKYGRGDEEQMVVVVSDLQIGHQTPTTNAKIVEERAKRLTRRVVKIANLHRKAYPIRTLNVFLLGDVVHGENIGKTINLDELEMVLSKQMFEVAIPILEQMLATFVHYFEKVVVWGLVGNHGRLSKEHADTTNMDGIVYRFLVERLKNYPIEWHMEYERFYQIAEIANHRFLLIHGDQIPMALTLPYYGVTTRAMRLQGSVGRFNYLVMGHFHVPNFLTWQDMEIVMNGTFVSDDQWVLHKLGMATQPKQVVFGVHERQGITFRYLVRLD